MSLAIWIVLAACAIAVATDLTSRRIPNALTIGLAATALGLHASQRGVECAQAGEAVRRIDRPDEDMRIKIQKSCSLRVAAKADETRHPRWCPAWHCCPCAAASTGRD